MPMNHVAITFDRKLPALILALTLAMASLPCLAADDADAPKGSAVTVLKAAKSCFSAIVEVSGILIPKEEISVRPERPGLKTDEIFVDAGDSVTINQLLARL